MRRPFAVLACLAVAAVTLLVPLEARAQFPGPGGMRPMGPGGHPQGGGAPGGGPGDSKEEGPAEAAPEEQGQEPAIQPLPAWPGQHEKSLQFFQLNGYIRGRFNLFHNFNLGVPFPTGTNTSPLPPFNPPYSEANVGGVQSASSCNAREGGNCRSDNLRSADMRLRFEPTINVSEQVRVKAQIDVFDNMVAGSTPEGYYLNGLSPARDAPISAFTRSQAPPEAGINSFRSSIRAKRAWAEVKTPIGELRFGRMPSHWGMGVLVNGGDCLDCDYGVNADRVMFVTKVWDHFVGVLYDWVASGPTTSLYYPNQSSTGPVYAADNLPGVSQIGMIIGRQDKPEEIRERIDRGELVLNYGGYFIYRWQDWDIANNPGPVSTHTGVISSPQDPSMLASNLTPRHAWAFVPDLWFRLNWKKLSIEAEGAVIGGKINAITDMVTTAKSGYNILQYGGVARAEYKLLHDALHVKMEIGYASGDSYEDPNARVNFRTSVVNYPDGATIGKFQFDPDYHVDLILFRRLLGAVSNATYFKPTIQYDLNEALSGKLDVIYSLANRPVSYPGNSVNLGVEIDASIMYKNEEEGFYAGIMYGVLFPLGALSLPSTIYPQGPHEPEAAQTLQVKMVVKF